MIEKSSDTYHPFLGWVQGNRCLLTYSSFVTQLRSSDFDNFDYIFAMDRSNLSNIQREQKKKPGSKAKVILFGDYSGTGEVEIVNDPYYGGKDGFETAYEQAVRFSTNFLKDVFPDVKA